jgi:4-hydroxybenzoate polyprenyltransferase
MKLLKLVRYENLLLLAAAQLIFRYGFLEQQADIPLALNHWQYALFVLACVLIAAGGAVIDHISGNGRQEQTVTEDEGYNLFIIFNLIALGIGAYLSYHIGNIQFVTGFIIGSGMLYIGATNFRTTILMPNIFTGLAAALSIVMIAILNFYPFMGMDGAYYLKIIFDVLLDYCYFAFVIVLMLTLANDLKNTDVDYNSGKATLPIALGRERAAKILFFVTIVPVAMILYYVNIYLTELIYAIGFVLLFVLGPLIYFAIKLWTAKTPKDFGHLGIVLKIVLLFAAISIIVITYNMNNNA